MSIVIRLNHVVSDITTRNLHYTKISKRALSTTVLFFVLLVVLVSLVLGLAIQFQIVGVDMYVPFIDVVDDVYAESDDDEVALVQIGSLIDDNTILLDYPTNVATFTVDSTLYAITTTKNGNAVLTIDLSDLSAPHIAGSLVGNDSISLYDAYGVDTFEIDSTPYAIVTVEYPGEVYVMDLSTPSAPLIVGNLTDNDDDIYIGDARGVDVFTVNSDTYAIVTTSSGNDVQLINLNTPSEPNLISSITDSDAFLYHATDVATFNIDNDNYALVSAQWDNGVQLINMSNPSVPTLSSNLSSDNIDHFSGPSDADVFTINSTSYAIVALTYSNGIHLLNVTDPSMLSSVGSLYDDSATVLDGSFAVDTFVMDSVTYALVTSPYEHGIQLININNPSTPIALGNLTADDSDVFAAHSAVKTFTTESGTYAIVASSGYSSSSISIVQIAYASQLPYTPVITTTTTSPTNQRVISFTVDFGRSIDPDTFTDTDISVSSGNVSSPSATDSNSNQIFDFTISEIADGTLTVSIPADAVDDPDEHKNLISNTVSIKVDGTAPYLASISRSTPTSESTSESILEFAVTFSEDVYGVVDSDDFVLSSESTGTGTITRVTGSGDSYFVTVDALSDGTFNLDIISDNNIVDSVDNALASTPAPVSDDSYTVVRTEFTPEITGITTSPTNQQTVSFQVDFQKQINATTFIASDVVASYGTVSTPATTNNKIFTFSVTGLNDDGVLTVSIPADAVEDPNGNKNLVSNTVTITIDNTAPSITSITRSSSASESTSSSTLDFTVAFSENVSGVDSSDFIVSGNGTGTISNVLGTGSSYTVTVRGTSDGTLGLALNANYDITDTAGNALSNSAPSENESYTLELPLFVPTITLDAYLTSNNYLNVKIDFGKPINPNSFTTSDIIISSATFPVSLTSTDNQIYTFTVYIINQGTHTLHIPASAVTDPEGNPNLVSNTVKITLDTTHPSITSISRHSPTTETTSETSIAFAVNFSEDVKNVDASDFDLDSNSGNTASISTVTPINASSYVVTVTDATAGTISLYVKPFANNITDLAGNALKTHPPPNPNESFTVDNTRFTPSISTDIQSPTNQQSITFTVDFGKPIDPDTFIASDISASSGTVSTPTTDDDQTFTFDITGLTAGTLTVSIPADSVDDLAQNKNLASETLTIIIDTTSPSLSSITRDSPASEHTSDTSLDFAVNFNEDVTNVDSTDFVLSTDVGAGTGTITLSTVSASSYIVSVKVTTVGIINLDVAQDNNITDTAGNDLTDTAPGTDEYFTVEVTQVPPLIRTDTPLLTNQRSITFTVNFGVKINATTFTASDVVVSQGIVSEPTSNFNQTFTFDITGLTTGDLTVSIPADSVDDLAQNKNLVSNTVTITIDTTAPSLTSITRSSPTSEHTSNTIPIFLVTFSEPVTPVDSSDFVLSTGVGTITVSPVDTSSYVVSVEVTTDGTINLDVAQDNDITDLVGNPMTTATAPNPDESFTVDTTQFTPLISANVTSPTNQQSITFTVDFTEEIDPDTFIESDITASDGTVSAPTTANNQTFTFDITELTTGILDVSINHDNVDDLARNKNLVSNTVNITIDTTAPSLTSITRNTAFPITSSTSLNFTATFSEPVTNVGPTDFVLSTVDGAGTGTITLSTVSASSYVVSVEVTTDGIINLDVAQDNDITDIAGNPLTTTTPNRDESFTVDTAPFTSFIRTTTTSPTNQQSITFTVDFGKLIDTATFIASDVSVSQGTVSTPIHHAQTSTFEITDLTAGDLTVHIPAGSVNSRIQNTNLVSNTLTITIDTTPPSLSSITRSSPTSEQTSLTSLDFAVTFSESVTNVSPTDFVLSTDAGAGTGTITVSTVSASSYVVTVADATAGTINLDVASNHDITDTAGNPLTTATAPNPDESFTVDTAQFTPLISFNTTSPTNQQSITFTVDFGEPIDASTFITSDISASYGTVSAPTTNDNQTFEFEITGLTAGTLTVSIPADSVDDLAQNKNLVSNTLTIIIDTTPPSLSSITRSSPTTELTSNTSLDFAVTFSESVTGVDTSDFAISGTGTGSASNISGSGSSYTVTVDVTSNSGTIGLSLVATNHGIIDSAGTALTDTSPDPDETYTIDAISPSLISITRNSPTTETTSETSLNFTATFSESVTNVTNVGPTDFVLSTQLGCCARQRHNRYYRQPPDNCYCT